MRTGWNVQGTYIRYRYIGVFWCRHRRFDTYPYKRRASLCSGSFLATMAEEALLEAHFALLSAQVRYHQEIVWLKRRRQQRQQKERRRLWCRECLGPLRRRQFGLYDQLIMELRREDPASFRNFLRMPPEMFDEILTRITQPCNERIMNDHNLQRTTQ